jgi:hypothetical protein
MPNAQDKGFFAGLVVALNLLAAGMADQPRPARAPQAGRDLHGDPLCLQESSLAWERSASVMDSTSRPLPFRPMAR